MTSKVLVRLLCLMLCLTVLLPCVTAMGETTKVATYLLRLREKPSTDSKVLDSYKRGTKVTILKKGTEWTKVSVGGKVGYMQTDKLAYAKYKTAEERETMASSSSSSGAKNASSGSTAYVMKGVRLNLRSEPEGDIIASFRGGTKVTILKKGKYYCYVEVKGMTGYMGTEFLTTERE